MPYALSLTELWPWLSVFCPGPDGPDGRDAPRAHLRSLTLRSPTIHGAGVDAQAAAGILMAALAVGVPASPPWFPSQAAPVV